MALPEDDERVVAVGPYGRVEFAVKSEGKMAEAWYWKEDLPDQKWLSFSVLIRRLVDEGVIHNVQQFKALTESVYEFKRGGDRLLCFRDGNRFLLTNTLKKSSRKDITQDITRSEELGKKHLQWEKLLKKTSSKQQQSVQVISDKKSAQ